MQVYDETFTGFPLHLEIKENLLEYESRFLQSGEIQGIWEKYLKSG